MSSIEGFVRFILYCLVGAVALYGIYLLYFYVNQRAMLFPRQYIPFTPPAFEAPDAIDLGVMTEDGLVEAWLLLPFTHETRAATDSPPYPVVIIGHGNAEIVDYWIEAVAPLRRQGMAALLVEYPGYGRSAGTPSERAIVDVFVQAYDTAIARPEIDADSVLFFGRSVGGGAVARLSTLRPAAGMVLFSTFTSVRDMAVLYRLPGGLARDPFNTLDAVREYDNPLLILHGEQDPIIPFAHAERIHAAAPNAELRPLPCAHNDCVDDWQAFWAELTDFWAVALHDQSSN